MKKMFWWKVTFFMLLVGFALGNAIMVSAMGSTPKKEIKAEDQTTGTVSDEGSQATGSEADTATDTAEPEDSDEGEDAESDDSE